MMGVLMGSFRGSERAMMKQAEKTCAKLWGQLMIFKTVSSNYLLLEKAQGVIDGIRANLRP